MSAPVRLSEIIEALEMQLDTEQVVPDAFLGKAEDGETPDLVGWEEPGWEVAKQIVASRDRFLDLPS